MNIREITDYMLKTYDNEILGSYYDKRGARKNNIKDKEKLSELKEQIKKVFNVDNLITEFKPGQSYNYSDRPWIQIRNEKITKATKGEYLGVSFNKKTLAIELWMGFGIGQGTNKMKKGEITFKREEYINKLKSIEPNLQRGFEYTSNDFYDAIMISKTIKLEDIVDEQVRKDLQYLAKIYSTYMEKYAGVVNNKNNNLDKYDEILFTGKEKPSGINIMYIGAPGTGKSYTVKKEFLTEKDNFGNPLQNDDGTFKLINQNKFETVVFYPEYTNANFIGSILPVSQNNIISYEFVPGPFTKILAKAIKYPDTNFYLVIEEINRGNAAAIFGEIFVLLDRENNNMGRSEYEISNDLISDYIYSYTNQKIKLEKIYIPDNLSIIATMNSCDQNVIPIDSAFRRRWDIVWLIDEENPDIDNLYIKGFGNVTWKKFRKAINAEIADKNNNLFQIEDKKLCSYFIDKSYLCTEPNNLAKYRDRFIYKIFTYLYNDVCKYNKTLLFKDDILSIDDFNDNIIKGLQDE